MSGDRADVVQALNVSRETLARLDRYVSLLGEWQRVLNLVAPSTFSDLWTRHILDSAQLVDHAPSSAMRWVDLGSGGGAPGLIVAALNADRIGFETVLVESDQRKAAFLRTAAREMGLGAKVRVVAERAEHILVPEFSCDVVSARALAPLARLAALAAHQLDSGAVGLFLKGENVASELTAWGPPAKFEVELCPSRTSPAASVVIVRKRASSPRQD